MAAVVGVKHYTEDPVKVVEGNICVTLSLLKLAWRSGVKVIFTSTSEIYGKNPYLPFNEYSERVYGPTNIDRWCYAVSKSAAEHVCFGYARRGLPVVILRYFNVYGPHADSSDYGSVIARFFNQALAGKPLMVYGDGSQTRCFTYIDDIVKGTIEASLRKEADGKAINLGCSRETSILELAGKIIALSGSKGGIEFKEHTTFYGPHYEDIKRRVPDITLAIRILDYQVRVPLEEGLKKTLAWYRCKKSSGKEQQ